MKISIKLVLISFVFTIFYSCGKDNISINIDERDEILNLGLDPDKVTVKGDYYTIDKDVTLHKDLLKKVHSENLDHNFFNVHERARHKVSISGWASKTNVQSIQYYIHSPDFSSTEQNAILDVISDYTALPKSRISFSSTSNASAADITFSRDTWNVSAGGQIPNNFNSLPIGTCADAILVSPSNVYQNVYDHIRVDVGFDIGSNYTSGGSTYMVSSAVWKHAIRHEIGHALFLHHIDTPSNSIVECTSGSYSGGLCNNYLMGSSCCNATTDLNSDEELALQLMYPEDFTNFTVGKILPVSTQNNTYKVNFSNDGGKAAKIGLFQYYDNSTGLTNFWSAESCASSSVLHLPAGPPFYQQGVDYTLELQFKIYNHKGDVVSTFIKDWWPPIEL